MTFADYKFKALSFMPCYRQALDDYHAMIHCLKLIHHKTSAYKARGIYLCNKQKIFFPLHWIQPVGLSKGQA